MFSKYFQVKGQLSGHKIRVNLNECAVQNINLFFYFIAAGTGPVIAIVIVAIIIIIVIVVAVIARSQGMLCFAGKSFYTISKNIVPSLSVFFIHVCLFNH